MEKLNARQIKALNRKDYDNYYKLNLDFHNVFLDLSGNNSLKSIVRPYKQRLYDFPRRGYIEEWELNNCKEHDQFIELIKKKDRIGAAEILRDVHWSFLVQEKHIRRFYPNVDGFDSL
jgi:DNA-binding GntR family transcriptional regulator